MRCCNGPKKFTRNAPGGFTLIEVLVVLVIVAIITMTTVLAFGDFGRGREEKIRVETFTRVMQAAQSQAILKPATYGLMITTKGYAFYQWVFAKNHGKWLPLGHDDISQPQAFKNFFMIRMKTVSGFDPVSTSYDAHPAIVILPSGFVTPFQVSLQGKVHHFILSVANNGSVKIRLKKSKVL